MFIDHTFTHAPRRYSYLLKDSKFEEIFHAYDFNCLNKDNTARDARSKIVSGIIKIYEKRNLPVAANLALLILYETKYYLCSVNDVMIWIKVCPEYTKYKNDIDKYIILL
jgi:hypothetical protein